MAPFELIWEKDAQTAKQVELERRAAPSGHFWVSLHSGRWLIHSSNTAGVYSVSNLLLGSRVNAQRRFAGRREGRRRGRGREGKNGKNKGGSRGNRKEGGGRKRDR